MEQNTKNKEKSNAENVSSSPALVAGNESTLGADASPLPASGAAHCSAGGVGDNIIVLPKSKWIINLNNVVSISQFYDPKYDTGMIVTTSGLFVGLPKEHFAELLEIIQGKTA